MKTNVQAIDVLMSEHRRIEQVLQALERWASVLEAGKTAALEDAKDVVEFLRFYADEGHHYKEEHLLFEAMIARGFPRQSGPIAVMLMEHEQGRAHVQGIERGAKEGAAGAASVALNARAFAQLLRAHISKEDQVLYVMAVQRLSEETFASLAEQFQVFDAKRHEQTLRLEAIANRLVQTYVG